MYDKFYQRGSNYMVIVRDCQSASLKISKVWSGYWECFDSIVSMTVGDLE